MRWLVGLLLVCAAALKAIALIAAPAVSLASPLGRFLVPLQIAAELGIGAFALSGLYWRQLRWAAVVLFTAFAAYSFYLATSGAASCGCFGPIEVHPWWTFVLDVAIVAGLLVSGIDENFETARPVHSRRHFATTLTFTALVAGGAVAWSRYVTLHGDVLAAGVGLTVLEPTEWIGRPLPIADSIDADLSSGKWIVLFHRHDCPECQRAAPRYEDLAYRDHIALVEVPPYGGESDGAGPARHARLREDREWFVQTPVEVRLQDGIVVGASTALPALATSQGL